MIRSISFIVLQRSDSNNLAKCKKNIEAQNIPEYEIRVGTLPDDKAAVTLNELCAQCTKDYIVILNSDLLLGHDWYASIHEHRSYDLFGCSIKDSKGRRMLDWFCQRTISGLTVALPLDYEDWTPDARLSNHFLMFHKQLWLDIQFEVEINLDWSESFCLNASKKGYRLGIVPESNAVLHDSKKLLSFFDRSQNLTKFSYDHHRLVTRAHRLIEAGRFGQAAKDYALLLEIHPDSVSILAKLGWAHFHNKNYEKALISFEKALTIEASDLSAQRGHAWACFHLENFPSALKSFSSAFKLTPASDSGTSQDICRGIGWALLRTGNRIEAAQHFKKALDFIGNGNDLQKKDALNGIHACENKK